MENPFVLKPYVSKQLFCDREQELNTLMTHCKNGTDVTLISQRRMGKTGLIYRLFDELKGTNVQTLYVDIFATRNMADFIKYLAEAAMKTFPQKTTLGERLFNFLRALRPVLSFDAVTGDPQLQIAYQTATEKELTLKSLLEFLDSQQVKIIIAIDEFQQIREYPEQNTEALLRTYIQQLQHTHFIFCGSKKHMMVDIFSNARKPFYASTIFIWLDKIPAESYSAFIRHQMERCGMTITDEAIQFILTWTRRHTYYTQQLCRTIVQIDQRDIDLTVVKMGCEQVMSMNEGTFLQYRSLLTNNQWDFLIAIAKEEAVSQVTSTAFLKKYDIPSAATARRLLEALLDKDLLNDNNTPKGTSYSLSDVFMSRWMERL